MQDGSVARKPAGPAPRLSLQARHARAIDHSCRGHNPTHLFEKVACKKETGRIVHRQSNNNFNGLLL